MCLHVLVCPAEGSSEVDVEALQKRVKRQESLLQRCKEMIRSSKERTAQLGSENEVLQEQLQERLQELEKIKVHKHRTHDTKPKDLCANVWIGLS